MAPSTINAPDIVDDFDALGTEIVARNNISSTSNTNQPPYEDTGATELPLGNVAKDEERRSSSSTNINEGGFFKKNKRMVKIGVGALAGTLVLCAAIFGSAAVTGKNNNNSMVRSQFNTANSKTPKSSKAPKPSVSKTFVFCPVGCSVGFRVLLLLLYRLRTYSIASLYCGIITDRRLTC